jgi:hypothetical protein
LSREEEEVLAIVSEWYALATQDGSVPSTSFFRFLALWVAFNGLYSLKFPKARTETAQVRSFGNWHKAKRAHTDALKQSRYRAAVDVLREKGVFNFLARKFEHLSDERDLGQVIALVYRVRCNLFHGRKVPSDLRDRRLVEAARVIVAELLARLIEFRPEHGGAV